MIKTNVALISICVCLKLRKLPACVFWVLDRLRSFELFTCYCHVQYTLCIEIALDCSYGFLKYIFTFSFRFMLLCLSLSTPTHTMQYTRKCPTRCATNITFLIMIAAMRKYYSSTFVIYVCHRMCKGISYQNFMYIRRLAMRMSL